MSKKKQSSILKCKASILDLEIKIEEIEEEKKRILEHIEKQKQRLKELEEDK